MTRPFGRTRAAFALLGALALVPRWLAMAPNGDAARARERLFHHRVARGVLARIARTGAPPAGPGTLFVCNHISWLDIPLLGSLLEVDFIAKSDVGGWPLIGPLSRRTGIVLVDRERRGTAAGQVDLIASRLAAGRSLMLFAEGTTSDGSGVLPFRSSLFAAANHARTIQPLALCYRNADGSALGGPDMAAVGWVGEESLVASAGRIARMPLSAEVRLIEPFSPEGQTRKAIAERCQRLVSATYAAMRGAAKRPE